MAVRVLNMLGSGAATAIAAVDGVEVIEVGPEIPDDLTGDVLFAAWTEHPIFGRLDVIGVDWMHLPGTGIDSWPRQLLTGRTVTCSRGVSGIPIAEFVLASMLAFEKRFPRMWLQEPPKHWNIANIDEIGGKTLGLVGLGGIGIEVARRALAFDMRVVAVRRTGAPAPTAGIEIVSGLDDLLPVADHLVLAAPATPRTQYLLDDETFARVKPGVHLVNIARGSLVDQDALRRALDDERVALASLDTVDPEPLPAGHWLYEHPRVHLSAHVSWGSRRAFDRILESFVDNLRRYTTGAPLAGIIDVDEGY
ncbi:MAG: NAD(P)-dependent oxidoreductase [Acidimicrobiia bacterium]